MKLITSARGARLRSKALVRLRREVLVWRRTPEAGLCPHADRTPMVCAQLPGGFHVLTGNGKQTGPWREYSVFLLDHVSPADATALAALDGETGLAKECKAASVLAQYLSLQDVALALDLPSPSVVSPLAAATTMPEVMVRIEAGTLVRGHVRLLVPLTPEVRHKALKAITEGGRGKGSSRLTVEGLRSWIAGPKPLEQPSKPPMVGAVPTAYREFLDNIAKQLQLEGIDCQFNDSPDSRFIALPFYTVGDLLHLFEAIGKAHATSTESSRKRWLRIPIEKLEEVEALLGHLYVDGG